MAEKNRTRDFLDSDDKWRRECIEEIQKIKKKVTEYEWMLPSEKAEICEGLRKTQNKFKIKTLF